MSKINSSAPPKLSFLNIHYLLESLRHQLYDSGYILRYCSQLLIFLGLIGTFWGLLKTITSINEMIGVLGPSTSDEIFSQWAENLKTHLSLPIEGMATAFSSSLFGICSAVILNFLDAHVTQAQNKFCYGIEKWLSQFASKDDHQNHSPQSSKNQKEIAEEIKELNENLSNLEINIKSSNRHNIKTHQTIRSAIEQMKDLMYEYKDKEYQVFNKITDIEKYLKDSPSPSETKYLIDQMKSLMKLFNSFIKEDK